MYPPLPNRSNHPHPHFSGFFVVFFIICRDTRKGFEGITDTGKFGTARGEPAVTMVVCSGEVLEDFLSGVCGKDVEER